MVKLSNVIGIGLLAIDTQILRIQKFNTGNQSFQN